MMLKAKRKRAVPVLLVLAVVIGVGAWWHLAHRDGSSSDAPATTVVQRRDMSSTVLATGSIKPQVGAEVRVGARISGKVERLYANIGDSVKKGQTIAELEKADLIAVVNQRKAELRLAEKELARDDLRLAQAKIQWVTDSETADLRERKQSLRPVHSQVLLHHIDDRSPYFEIKILYFCSSIVTFQIGPSISGHIAWMGEPLSRLPELIFEEGKRQVSVSRRDEPLLCLRQYVNEAEATGIREQRESIWGLMFCLDDLDVSLDAFRHGGDKVWQGRLHLPEWVDQDPKRWIPD